MSHHSAERSEKLNQANLAMITTRLLVEERKQMLHETGRALRDQPSLIAVIGKSSMVESSRIWSGRQDGIKPQHNRAAQHCRQPASATSKSLHSLSAYLACPLQHPNFGFRKKEAFEASTKIYLGVPPRYLASASTGTHLQVTRRLGQCR